MSYEIPQEYKNFVTNADILLEQFSSFTENDERCLYSIYMIDNKTNSINDSILSLFDSINQFTKEIIKDYIWQVEPFCLNICKSDENFYFLQGSSKFGENIEDEWFIVFILKEISLKFSNLVACITDSDGQFLLIETADYLPNWLSPENSENRIWLKNGRLHIINIDECGGSSHEGISLNQALDVLKLSKDTEAEERVQKALKLRLNKFPEYAYASMHTQVCILTQPIAKLYAINPQLVSDAAAAFSDGLKEKKSIQIISSMKKFGDGFDELVRVPIKFTRAQYAKLTFQKFNPPRKFHSIISSIASSSLSNKKEIDIGCRIMCGLELCYDMSMKERNGPTSIAETIDTFVESIKALHISEKNINLDPSHVHDYLLNIVLDHDSGSFNKIYRIITPQIPVFIKLDLISSSEKYKSFKVGEFQGVSESDDWLYMSPEEFDREMAQRATLMATNNAGGEKSNEFSSHDPPSPLQPTTEKNEREKIDDMDKIVHGVKNFMKLDSDYEGIEPAEGDSSSHNLDDINIDKFVNILRQEIFAEQSDGLRGDKLEDDIFDDYDDEEEFSDDSNLSDFDITDFNELESPAGASQDSAYNFNGGNSGIGSFLLPHDRGVNNTRQKNDLEDFNYDDNKSLDSDDAEEFQSFFKNSKFMDEYIAAMDKELGTSSLNETFEKNANNEKNMTEQERQEIKDSLVNIDLNLLKNLLESHSLEIGGSGPASNLLAQLGLNFPQEVPLNEED